MLARRFCAAALLLLCLVTCAAMTIEEVWRAIETLELHERSPFALLDNTEHWTQDYAVMFHRNGYPGYAKHDINIKAVDSDSISNSIRTRACILSSHNLAACAVGS
jgi:hypothetical protein